MCEEQAGEDDNMKELQAEDSDEEQSEETWDEFYQNFDNKTLEEMCFGAPDEDEEAEPAEQPAEESDEMDTSE